MDFDSWLSSLHPAPPKTWTNWLKDVFFTLECIAESNDTGASAFALRLKNLLTHQKTLLEQEATKIGWTPKWGCTLPDLLMAKEELEEQIQLSTAYQDIKKKAAKEGFSLLELQPPYTLPLVLCVQNEFSEKIQNKHEQQTRDAEWALLRAECQQLACFSFSFAREHPRAQDVLELKEQISTYRKIESECRQLELRARCVSFPIPSFETLMTTIVERKMASYEIEKREALWIELEHIEAAYRSIGIVKTFDLAERLLLLEAGVEAEHTRLHNAQDAAMSFDAQWRVVLAEAESTLAPNLRSQLPVLPALITPENSVSVLEAYHNIEKRNRKSLWTYFFWLFPRYYRDRNLLKLRRKQQSLRTLTTYTLVSISTDSFLMGALPDDTNAEDSELPRHMVTLHTDVLMSAYPCSQELYSFVMGTNPSYFVDPNHPVENVSWFDALLFCNRLSLLEGLEPAYKIPRFFTQSTHLVTWNKDATGYRLPTEAEWEYCARGGAYQRYSGSDTIDDVGWHWGTSRSTTHPVGQKKSNAYGLYDMSGHVWEWVWDSDRRPYLSTEIDPIAVDIAHAPRITRGGSFLSDAWFSRVSCRNREAASMRSNYLGFRFCRTR